MDAGNTAEVARNADMLSIMGTQPRLRIMRLLLSSHPNGMVVGDIHESFALAGSILSRHLEKLKNHDLVHVRRDGKFLWYSANTDTLRELLSFLYAECCYRNPVIRIDSILSSVSKENSQGEQE